MKTPTNFYFIKGGEAGPKTVIIGGTHGDELTGINVVNKLLNFFNASFIKNDPIDRSDLNGDLYIGLGNPAAIAAGKRAAGAGRDLNRSFVEEEIAGKADKNDRPDLLRARELAPLLASADYLIDIHSTSSDSPPFVCFGKNSFERSRLYRAMPVHYILTDPDDLLTADEHHKNGTTDNFVSAHGGTAIAYETGKEDDVSKSEQVFNTVIDLLKMTNSLKLPQGEKKDQVHEQTVYKIAFNIVAKDDTFTFEPNMARGWQPVASGQIIGRYANGEEERSPSDGMLVFPKAKNKILAGKNIFYIATKID
jgi:predicted deacylase